MQWLDVVRLMQNAERRDSGQSNLRVDVGWRAGKKSFSGVGAMRACDDANTFCGYSARGQADGGLTASLDTAWRKNQVFVRSETVVSAYVIASHKDMAWRVSCTLFEAADGESFQKNFHR